MILRILNKLKTAANDLAPRPPRIAQRELIKHLTTIPHWEKKIDFYSNYEYSDQEGVWVEKSAASKEPGLPVDPSSGLAATKVNYGCGGNLIKEWLNVDLYEADQPGYRSVNLLAKHPFADNSLAFGFSEDMLEHLDQAQSIFFVGEVYRCLKPGGVLRLSFPGLEGVLERHYTPPSQTRLRQGEFEAYAFWDHVHFYSKAELELVARHIGFSRADIVEYGESTHAELRNRDTRANQRGLNTYIELTK